MSEPPISPRDERNTAERLFEDAELLFEGSPEGSHEFDNDIMINLLRAIYLRLTEIAERQ